MSEIKNCPKCNDSFTCKVNDISNCQCNIQISEATKTFLQKTNFDCLCSKCLLHYNSLVKESAYSIFPEKKEMFVESVHYYKENNYWVFTEFYHLLRGHCCQNGCRHCAYGFKK